MLKPEDIERVVHSISSMVLQATLPIYTFSKNRYAIHSNGILLLESNSYCLLTAEHTFENMDPGDLFIFQRGLFRHLEGKIIGNDFHDIALFEIDNNIADFLSENYIFINRARIAFDHIAEAKQKYLLIGYPSSKTKIIGFKILEKPLVYHTSAMKKQPNSNEITFEYNKRKSVTYEKRIYISAPDPDGLSGCGLWYVNSFSNNVDYGLVGVFKEFDRMKNVGTAAHVKSLLARK